MKALRLLLLLSALLLPWTPALQPVGVTHTGVALAAAPEDAPPPAAPNIDVNINGGGTQRHFISIDNPVVIAAAVIGVVLIVAFIAMAARGGGGTTIIREEK